MPKIKEFLKLDELIKIIKLKGIKIEDEKNVKDILMKNNYYVITGYRTLFMDKNHNYRENTSFENIYNLYLFDRKLKLLLFNSLLDIENIIKTSIINRFCNMYGFKEKNYLDKNNYNVNHKYLEKTFKVLKKQIEEKQDSNLAVSYYKNTYGFLPLWVVTKVLSFGIVKELYSILKDDDKIAIKNEISNFDDVKIKGLFTSMQLLVDMRNKTAHDEIVYNCSHRKIILSKIKEHTKFKLSHNQGLNDLFGVLISVKNIQIKSKFNKLIDDINELINNYVENNSIISKDELLTEMGFPNNFLALKWENVESSVN